MSDGVSLGGGRGIWEDCGFGVWDLGWVLWISWPLTESRGRDVII